MLSWPTIISAERARARARARTLYSLSIHNIYAYVAFFFAPLRDRGFVYIYFFNSKIKAPPCETVHVTFIGHYCPMHKLYMPDVSTICSLSLPC
ncbi:hypothetical protein BC938DRAFT_473539, partial [Jimgerdemannia flammicorona]